MANAPIDTETSTIVASFLLSRRLNIEVDRFIYGANIVQNINILSTVRQKSFFILNAKAEILLQKIGSFFYIG